MNDDLRKELQKFLEEPGSQVTPGDDSYASLVAFQETVDKYYRMAGLDWVEILDERRDRTHNDLISLLLIRVTDDGRRIAEG